MIGYEKMVVKRDWLQGSRKVIQDWLDWLHRKRLYRIGVREVGMIGDATGRRKMLWKDVFSYYEIVATRG